MKPPLNQIEPGVWYESGTVYYYSPRLIENCLVRDRAQQMIQGPSLSCLFYSLEKDDRPQLVIELEMMLLISTNVSAFLRLFMKGRGIKRRVELLD